MRHPSLIVYRARARRSFRKFTWGGEWAISLAGQIKHNLHWFFFDGLFASATDNIMVTYLSLYILALGATSTQVGLMSSFSSLSAALLLLPGALLVERIGRRKEITLFFGGTLGRLAILILALLPILFSGQLLVWVVMAFSVLRDGMNNFAFPAWMSLAGEIVPVEGRGRYFGSRNFVIGVVGMLAILLVGELITAAPRPLGYQIAFGLAFVTGMLSTFSYSRIKDPGGAALTQTDSRFSLRALWRDIRSHPAFMSLCMVMAVWNFSLNIAGPFFNVYMVRDLNFTASMVGIASIVTSITSLFVQHRMGRLSDRLGPRRVQLISMLLIPLLPAAWVLITQFWHVVLLNSFSGILWGTFNLVSFNFLLSITPQAQRARYSAIYQVLVTLALAFGAAFGSWLVARFGYPAVFWGSAIGRLAAGLLFARLIPQTLSGRAEVPA